MFTLHTTTLRLAIEDLDNSIYCQDSEVDEQNTKVSIQCQ